jgi:hypothetical protein
LARTITTQAEGTFNVAGMFALSAFVILIDLGATLVERRLLIWQPNVADGRSLYFIHHCEEQSDEAIQFLAGLWIALLGSQ